MLTRRVTPASVLVTAVLIVAILVLLMPRPDGEGGPPLGSRSMGVYGAGGVYRTLQRLGYRTSRNQSPFDTVLSPNATYVLLAPALPVTSEEAGRLTDAVRRGATVIFTPSGGALTDSLGFSVAEAVSALHTVDQTSVIGGPAPSNPTPFLPTPLTTSARFADSTGKAHGIAFLWFDPAVTDTDPTTGDVPAAPTHAGTSTLVVHILGRRFGAGHAIAIAPAIVASNALVRRGPPAVAFVRAIEWADAEAGAPRPVIFDEYHHGEGEPASPMGATIDALVGTPLGRTTLMGIAAALVLLLAVGARPIAPLPVTVVPRRSPLEHVQALARAYLQSGADRFGTAQLVRGLRRRHPLGLPRGIGDRVYLETVRTRFPERAPDAVTVIAALEHGTDGTGRITSTRDAVARIEQTLQTAMRARAPERAGTSLR